MSKEITITLPDGTQKQAPVGISGSEIANMIGAGLAKAAIAFEVNGEQRDLSDTVTKDSNISIYTIDSDEGLEIMRHTVAAQVLARAIKNLYPNAKLAIGPTIENGFYYDFLCDERVSIGDLPKIETDTFNLDFSSSTSSTKPLNEAKGPSQTFTCSPISKVI